MVTRAGTVKGGGDDTHFRLLLTEILLGHHLLEVFVSLFYLPLHQFVENLTDGVPKLQAEIPAVRRGIGRVRHLKIIEQIVLPGIRGAAKGHVYLYPRIFTLQPVPGAWFNGVA